MKRALQVIQDEATEKVSECHHFLIEENTDSTAYNESHKFCC